MGWKFVKGEPGVKDLDPWILPCKRHATETFAMPIFFDAPKKKKGKQFCLFFAEFLINDSETSRCFFF